ncbi:hypothetical protein DH2020_001477 [Rehmannia glutinosa]|uniref:Beta-carotene isomerase D27-like C-terminal domain-containing protein n=1 Tax=Rehmannia glutinosa TaxID=99300 RepID=A0ABR0XZN4_REHGL
MDATLMLPCKSLFRPPRIFNRRVIMQNPRCSPFVLSVLSGNNLETSSVPSHESKTVYNDNWLETIAINYLSDALQAASGVKSNKSGYDGLVETTKMVYAKFTPIQQRQLLLETLDKAVPKDFRDLNRTMFPPSKFSREYMAAFTTLAFAWMVGPMEVKESEFEGKPEKNVVHIKKCRLLEATNCVGICTSLCKMPSQIFIKEFTGMPMNMVPNFDDMSCEYIYGEEPQPEALDPAFTQPCYKLCNSFSFLFFYCHV